MDADEILQEAIDYFLARKKENRQVCKAIGQLKGSLTGLPDGSFFDADIDLVSNWLDDLAYPVYRDRFDDSDRYVDSVFDYYIYANDHKAAIVGKELAPYV